MLASPADDRDPRRTLSEDRSAPEMIVYPVWLRVLGEEVTADIEAPSSHRILIQSARAQQA
jgi:hypothetical protein